MMAVFIGVALLVTAGFLVIKVMILLLLPSSLLSSSSVVVKVEVKVKDATVSQGDNGKVIGVDGDDGDGDDDFLSMLFGNVDVIDE